MSDCHQCECSLGTIVCHQHKCPPLTCLHTVTLSGHCCPICQDQLAFFNYQDKCKSSLLFSTFISLWFCFLVQITSSRFSFWIIILFSILIFIAIAVILILLYCLIHGKHRSQSSSSQISHLQHRSPKLSHHHQSMINAKLTHLISDGCDVILRSSGSTTKTRILS